jgi:hypothetical protein
MSFFQIYFDAVILSVVHHNLTNKSAKPNGGRMSCQAALGVSPWLTNSAAGPNQPGNRS